MIIVYGTRFYGRVRECGRSFVGTQFVHIYWIPLIPIGTRLVLEEVGGQYRTLNTGFSFTSMMAGYLRIWGPLALIGALCIGIGGVQDLAEDREMTGALVLGAFTAFVSLALLAGTVYSWAFFGKLSDEAKRKHSVYALHTGYHVDPADMGDARQNLRHSMMNIIAERAHGLASMGYRGPGDPSTAWAHYALDPTHNDEQLITAAFTLSRIEHSLAAGPYKSQMDQVHDQLWRRISMSNAPYLHSHAA